MPDDLALRNANSPADVYEEEQAMMLLYDLMQQGMDAPAALQQALTAYPSQAALLAEYLVHGEGLAQASVVAEDDPLAAMVQRTATAQAEARKDPRIDSLLARARERYGDLDRLCGQLRIGTSLLTKLDRRLIDLATIPAAFLQRLSGELAVPLDALRAYLDGPPKLSAAAQYKSRKPPRAGAKQSFAKAAEAAIAAGEISDSEGRVWLSGDNGSNPPGDHR